jgi:hypothetical protein
MINLYVARLSFTLERPMIAADRVMIKNLSIITVVGTVEEL